MPQLGSQLKRLGKHSIVYGLGGLISRVLAVLLLPLYTRYLSRSDYGEVEILIAATAVLSILLRFGISNAFFRFYFDTPDPDKRITVLRTSFWFTMTMATAGRDGNRASNFEPHIMRAADRRANAIAAA